jgi:hypothetical protein
MADGALHGPAFDADQVCPCADRCPGASAVVGGAHLIGFGFGRDQEAA